MSDIMNKVGDILDLAKSALTEKNVLKVTVTLEMMIKAAQFVREAWKEFEGDEPTTEEQLALYDKYDQFYLSAKAEMKAKIKEAREK